jgi:hypothetical protein
MTPKMTFLKLATVLLLFLCLINNTFSQTFTKITLGAFVNDGGASRSVNFIDYDGDGSLDLFVSNGKRFGQRNFLYRYSAGNFIKITGSQITGDSLPFDGASWADFDNDGKPDLCAVTWYDSTNVLYHNEGNGVFTLLGNSPVVTNRGFSETCTWGDYDNDGLVDLFISNSSGIGSWRNRLYKNLGGGNFVSIDTGAISLDLNRGSRGVNWVDIDGDGRLDIYICSENNQSNLCYKNNGGGYFTKITTSVIVTDGGHSWSSSWGDYDNDGDLDLFVARQGNQPNALYRNDGSFNFTKITNDTLVNDPGYYACALWGDFDNDGDLDLFVTQAYGPAGVPLKNCLYKNLLIETGTIRFEKITIGDIVNDLGYSYGCAAADWNRDGFLDIFTAKTFNENENNSAYLNNGNSNKWLEIKCIGETSNKSAIGTKVRVKSIINGNPVWQLRVVEGQSGYCGENLDQHFGLGNASVIDSIKVEWPSGNISYFTAIGTNQYLTIDETQGIIGLQQNSNEIPKNFTLHQNRPNPFNPSTKIEFSLPRKDFADLSLYDITGRFIKKLFSKELTAGDYSYDFDGISLASGVYFYKLSVSNYTETKKMVLIK